MKNYVIRDIQGKDDAFMFSLIRSSLKSYGLDIPGTAYYDPEIEHLSVFYAQKPDIRRYSVVTDENDNVLGGAGVAEFSKIGGCAEIQKLYVADEARGLGLGRKLMEAAEEYAVETGYSMLYLETHSKLEAAVRLYQKLGFSAIERPEWVVHSTMDTFMIKKLQG